MALLKRMAISKTNSRRKDAATQLLAAKDRQVVTAWNRQLEAEIRRKRARPGRTR